MDCSDTNFGAPAPNTNNESVIQIAAEICQAADRGDTSTINSLLHDHPILPLLEFFEKMIGCRSHDEHVSGCDILPLSVKAHLMLRAFLQFPQSTTLSWDAAQLAIKSLQYSSSNQSPDKGKLSPLSHGEQLAIISELRSYITSLRMVQYNSFGNSSGHNDPVFVIHRLADLGIAILAPLRKDNATTTTTTTMRIKRRLNTYLLPLELIPTIMSSMDTINDVRAAQTIPGDISSINNSNIDEVDVSQISSSENFLSTMFASYDVDNDSDKYIKKFERTIRADALLPLLSLSIDDIGFERMTMILPTDDRTTYWDCLKYALNDVIHANLICYSDEEINELQQHIVDEASHDEGIHIIPLSDYPALMRCLFRMIDVSSTFSSHAPIGLSWESTFLRLYHAAVVATARAPFESAHERTNLRLADRSSLLSTIELHVLLPSCTGASVSTITSILEACSRDCCIECTQDAVGGHTSLPIFGSSAITAVPAWAIAGVVLIIMRARSSNQFPSANATSFGPRAVFRMASNLMLKRSHETKIKQPNSKGGDDVGCALKVLLRLSTVRECVCLNCRGDKYGDDTEKHAYDVLKYAYYGGHDLFFHRYQGPDNANNSYQYELGMQTLSSISKLIRSSLIHGALHTDRKNQSSFILDTAKTWIDAANMLLDENLHSTNSGTRTRNIQEGTALAVVIIVVVFFEVPASQEVIVRSIYKRLSNITLHTQNGIGRKVDRSVFLLISILAWSLVSNNGDYSCNDIVYPVSGKVQREQATAVLEPFCNLLSKSAQRRDQYQHEKEDFPRLSYWVLRMLARALLPISSGREVILAMTRKNMSIFQNTSTDVHSFESLQCSTSSGNDAFYFVIDCLCALIEKYHPLNHSRTDDCGLAALGILSDLIILQKLSSSSSSSSRVPIDCVLWTISELKNRASSRKLSGWISQRLLRVCYVALLPFVAIQESEEDVYSACFNAENMWAKFNSSLLPKAGQYISGLLRLAICLYNESARINAAPDANILLNHPVLRSVLSGTSRELAGVSDDVKNRDKITQLREGHGALLKGFDSTDVSKGRSVDSAILVLLFEAAARMVPRSHIIPAGRNDHDSMKRMKEYILFAERFHHLEVNVQHRSLPLPTWIEYPMSFLCDNNRYRQSAILKEDALFDCAEFKMFRLSLCDILAEILLQQWAQQHHQSGFTVDRELSILHGVNTLLQYKRQTKSSKGLTGNIPPCIQLEFSTHLLRQLLGTSEKRSGVLPELETLVLTVLDVCKIDPLRIQSQSTQSQILSTFSLLYGSLCDEESSQILISFVKESYIEMGQWAGNTESTFSFLSITSSEDLDYRVRFLREAILTTLSLVLSSISRTPNISSIDGRKANLDILFQLLLQLCQDLDASFQGHSGGIQKKLFLLFLDAIDKCVDAIVSLFDSIPASTQRQSIKSFKSVHQASTIIWEIFCENTLRQATVVKSTLRLCVDKIPNMLLRVERIVQDCILNEPPLELTCELLDKCCAKLMSNSVLQASDLSSVNATSALELDNMRSISTGENANEGHNSTEIRRSRIPNITTYSRLAWVYNCVFVSLTNAWNDSYRIISGGTKSNRHMNDLEKSTSHARQRITSLSRGISSLCRLFNQQFELTSDADVKSERSTKIIVELLSHYGKSNICNCAEKICITLVLALKKISKYFRESTHTTDGGWSLLNDSRLHESLICVLGWSQSVKAKGATYNLITGFLRWQLNEKRVFNIASLDDGDVSPIIGRLPKVILRLEGLVAELRKLVLVLSTGNDKDLGEKRTALDQRITSLVGKGEVGGEPEGVLNMLQSSIKSIDDSKNTLQSNDNGNLHYDDEDSDANMDEDDLISSGKKRNRYGTVRKSRRVSLRSRNDTIDNWLTIDDDEFGTAPGEKFNADDAFVDLEDFIVEG